MVEFTLEAGGYLLLGKPEHRHTQREARKKEGERVEKGPERPSSQQSRAEIRQT